MKKKVFVSTGFYKKDSPLEVIKSFNHNEIKQVELSGGRYINKKNLNKLILINNKNINIRIHNYFPAPKSKFVINLASENKIIIKKSMKQLKNSILLAKNLNNEFFSFHAGFRVDPKPKNLGKRFEKIKLIEKKQAEKNFYNNLLILNKFAKKNSVKLLIENNVVNKKNFKVFRGNPLLLTSPNEIINFFKKLPGDIGFLLDVGHLKVSSKTEKFDLKKGIIKLNEITKGYHLSNNNSLEDQNKNFSSKVWFLKYLKKNLNYYTLEIYNTKLKEIYKTKLMVENFINKKN